MRDQIWGGCPQGFGAGCHGDYWPQCTNSEVPATELQGLIAAGMPKILAAPPAILLKNFDVLNIPQNALDSQKLHLVNTSNMPRLVQNA